MKEQRIEEGKQKARSIRENSENDIMFISATETYRVNIESVRKKKAITVSNGKAVNT